MGTATLVEQYARQERWRRWDEALARVPLRAGDRVLDLGCGLGQVTERIARRGAEVVGLDMDEELLSAARARHPGLRFERADVRLLRPETFGPVDGIWASFVTAYLGDLSPVLEHWSSCLVAGGWLALVEMDDLLGHAPLAAGYVQEIQAFYADARQAGRYDFQAGRRLAGAARAAGLRILGDTVLDDDELSFSGPAPDEVLDAWRLRLVRMGGLREFLGTPFALFERAFLDALAAPEHLSMCRVIMVVAAKPR